MRTHWTTLNPNLTYHSLLNPRLGWLRYAVRADGRLIRAWLTPRYWVG